MRHHVPKSTVFGAQSVVRSLRRLPPIRSALRAERTFGIARAGNLLCLFSRSRPYGRGLVDAPGRAFFRSASEPPVRGKVSETSAMAIAAHANSLARLGSDIGVLLASWSRTVVEISGRGAPGSPAARAAANRSSGEGRQEQHPDHVHAGHAAVVGVVAGKGLVLLGGNLLLAFLLHLVRAAHAAAGRARPDGRGRHRQRYRR